METVILRAQDKTTTLFVRSLKIVLRLSQPDSEARQMRRMASHFEEGQWNQVQGSVASQKARFISPFYEHLHAQRVWTTDAAFAWTHFLVSESYVRRIMQPRAYISISDAPMKTYDVNP